jgi:hypothetical protein
MVSVRKDLINGLGETDTHYLQGVSSQTGKLSTNGALGS